MKKVNKTEALLVGLFMVTMAGVLLFVYKKNTKPGSTKNLVKENLEEERSFSEVVSSFSDKLSLKLNEAENQLKRKQSHFNIPAGELGLFL